MAASCVIRPVDCLGGGNRAFLDAHRGVRAAPAPVSRRPVQQQGGQVSTMAVPGQPRPVVRGRPNGRHRGRRSPPPRDAGSPTHKKPVMENVVILKRGEMIQPKVSVALEAKKAGEPEAEAATERGAQEEKVVAAAADTYITIAEKAALETAEPVKKAGAAVQGGADATEAKVLADQCVPPASRPKEVKHVPVKVVEVKPGEQEMKVHVAPLAGYSGPSFVVAPPEPRELPIPVLLLKGRGARLCPRDSERPPSVAAAA